KNLTQGLRYYHELNLYLDEKVHVAHLSDTYGEFDYLLSLQSGNRKVVGIINNAGKRAVAESIYWRKQRQVRFVSELDVSCPILVIHPSVEFSCVPSSFLEGFQEIYIFERAQPLLTLGWKEERSEERRVGKECR